MPSFFIAATVRQIHEDLTDPPSYSTVRKIVERLEEKGAVRRITKRNRAWVYRAAVPASRLLQKEIRRFLDVAFDGAAAPLIAQLADMNAVMRKWKIALPSQTADCVTFLLEYAELGTD